MASRFTPLAAVGLVTLGVVNAFMLAGFIWSLTGEPSAVAPTEWKPDLSASDDAPEASKPIAAYTLVLAHPIFFKTREPFVPPPPPPPPPRPAAPPPPVIDPGISVAGVLISGPIRKAYLMSRSDTLGTWVREGEKYDGWTVQSVTAGNAKLQRDERSLELSLYPGR
ncbi:MAG TPA: hypothetical protein VKX28_25075 [Xanthobacteraceae bacterium]|nr:hypothetical protein [Xanthobacteraceae bacterium]